MNIFTNILIIFIFVYVLLYFKIIDVENGLYIQHHVAIFMLLFFFQFCTLILVKIKNQCGIDIGGAINHSLKIALAGVIGYSIYIDLIFMEQTKGFMASLIESEYAKYFTINCSIVSCIMLTKMIGLMFNTQETQCSA